MRIKGGQRDPHDEPDVNVSCLGPSMAGLRVSSKPKTLQFLAFRRDNGEDAIPGGFCDFGCSVPKANKFLEKLNPFSSRKSSKTNTDSASEKAKESKQKLQDFLNEEFSNPITIYEGYVDDPRNTE